jgi:hypothetical protein
MVLLPSLAVGDEARVEVVGDLPRIGSLTLRQLEQLGPVTASWTEHEKKYEVTGVPLDRLLTAFGFTGGPEGKDVPAREKHAGWRKVVLATAKDGYRVAISCAEVSPDIGSTRALVVWKVDGKPLAAERGPFQMVVTTDREPSRALRGLEKLEVVDAAAVAASAGQRR